MISPGGLRLPSPHRRAWGLIIVVVALVLGAALTVVHFQQTKTLLSATAALERLNDAETLLSRGFLIAKMSTIPGAPYDRVQGLALIDEATRSLVEFDNLWFAVLPESSPVTPVLKDYREQTNRFKDLLTRGSEVELRVAYFRLNVLTDTLDNLSHQQLKDLSGRLDGEFLATIGLAIVFVALLAVFLTVLARTRSDAEVRLDQVSRELGLGFWQKDMITERVEASDAWRRLMGIPQGDRLNNQWRDHIYPEDKDAFYQRFNDFLGSTTNDFTCQVRIVHPGGEIRWVQTIMTLIRDSKGTPLRLFGCNVDVTETRQMELDHAALQGRMAQAQKTDALGKLAGGIAHDLNNLLVPLLAYSELGLGDRGLKPAAYYFQKINDVAHRAQGLARQILAFSRQQVLEKRPLSLSNLVSDFLPILRRLVPEDIRFEVALTDGLPTILADPGQVEQVLLNLVVNARDAMPSGGVLGITTGVKDLDESFIDTHFGAAQGRHVVMAVSDTGIGMDTELQSKIFEPFFTTKPRGQGTGLGLATVQGIVKQHGGHLGVYSEVGHGTVFQVYWPAGQPDLAVEPAPVASGVQGGGETILVVEDEEIVREVVCEALESQGYRVLSVPSPVDALDVDRRFDLLVTDVVMPDLNGRELARTLEERFGPLKVLYISGYTNRILSEPDRVTPGHGFLQKPFAVDALYRKVRELLDAELDRPASKTPEP